METEPLWKLINKADPHKRRVLIALKPVTKARGFFHGTSLMGANAFKTEKARLLRSIPDLREAKPSPIVLANGKQLPVFAAKVESKTTLAKLQKLPSVDYVEPKVILAESITCGAAM